MEKENREEGEREREWLSCVRSNYRSRGSVFPVYKIFQDAKVRDTVR